MRERYILVVLSLRLVRISARYAPPRAGTSARARALPDRCVLAEGMMPCRSHPAPRGGRRYPRTVDSTADRRGGSSDLVTTPLRAGRRLIKTLPVDDGRFARHPACPHIRKGGEGGGGGGILRKYVAADTGGRVRHALAERRAIYPE